MAGFMTYWSKEYIRNLKKAGDQGALTVTLAEGTLCVVGKLPWRKSNRLLIIWCERPGRFTALSGCFC